MASIPLFLSASTRGCGRRSYWESGFSANSSHSSEPRSSRAPETAGSPRRRWSPKAVAGLGERADGTSGRQHHDPGVWGPTACALGLLDRWFSSAGYLVGGQAGHRQTKPGKQGRLLSLLEPPGVGQDPGFAANGISSLSYPRGAQAGSLSQQCPAASRGLRGWEQG